MKLSVSQLRNIIKEEVSRMLRENEDVSSTETPIEALDRSIDELKKKAEEERDETLVELVQVLNKSLNSIEEVLNTEMGQGHRAFDPQTPDAKKQRKGKFIEDYLEAFLEGLEDIKNRLQGDHEGLVEKIITAYGAYFEHLKEKFPDLDPQPRIEESRLRRKLRRR